jgi:hypothetical protein
VVTASLSSGIQSRDATMSNYKLFCVTLATPPVSATATADSSGNVTLTINAQSTPFGCFVEDSSGNMVAPLLFQASGTTSTNATFSSNTALGTVTVDLTNKIAQATVSSTGNLVTTTPSGLGCEVGTWTFTTSGSAPSVCPVGSKTTTVGHFYQNPDGTYSGTSVTSNIVVSKNGVDACGSISGGDTHLRFQ